MLLTDFLIRNWRRPATSSAVILAIWSQCLLASSSAAATDNASKASSLKTMKRPASRLGVSAVVLPRCAVRLHSVSLQDSRQPLEVQCTRSTEFQLGIQQAGQKNVLIKSATYTSNQAEELLGRSNGQTAEFQLLRSSASNKKNKTLKRVAILSLDF